MTYEIRECRASGRNWTVRARSIEGAIRQIFGRRRGWWQDNGLRVDGPTEYGQVVEPLRGNPGGYNCVTDRLRISWS